jgi:sulfatase maturation enzyme AslB (radical SAM superfamily)
MGAIAGSAILDCSQTNTLDTVTLTINNSCNLKCPHCYLQYEGAGKQCCEHDIFALIERSSFRHLAIVGKEPFLDPNSTKMCHELAELCTNRGMSISVVTNGLNVASAPKSLLQLFSFVDVSLDGGRTSYGSYRGGSIAKLQRSLDFLVANKSTINALHVLNSTTLSFLDEMLAVRDLAPFHRVVFSPYLKTKNHGLNTVGPLALLPLLERLSKSAFKETTNATLLLHGEHLEQSGIEPESFWAIVDRYGLRRNVRLIEDDPLTYGVIRVTYDGLVLSPRQALHTQTYRFSSHLTVADLTESTLESAFTRIGKAILPIQ